MKINKLLKVQFIVFFSFFIVTMSIVTALFGMKQLSVAVEKTFAVQGAYIVERAVSFIDGDAFEALTRSLDVDDPFYEEIRVKLFNLKEATGCLYLYTMAPVGGDVRQTDWMFIIDGSAEPDDEDHFSALGEIDDTSGYDAAFRRLFVSGHTEATRLVDQGEWGWLVSVYTPIKNSAGRIVGIVGCDFDGEPLYNAVVMGQRQMIIIGVISVILGLALLIVFLRLIFTPLGKINAILKELSLGEGDLTKRIKIDKDNEIGELSSYFNMTLDKIKNLIITIKKEAIKLHDIGEDLASDMQQTAGAINQITSHVQAIKQKAAGQSASVSESHATMEQVTLNIGKLGKNVEVQTASVSESSSAIEEMVANVQSVTQTLIRNAENVHELIKVSDEGRNSLQKVTFDIQEIAKESEGLLKINAVMENIASQTSLLSMNAAIEAAHAGEAGRGFAVVAAEIRKLATNSAEQSKTISDVLRKIKTAIDAITSSTNIVLEKFQAIDGMVRTVSEQEINIRNAMEEQGQGSQIILEAISRLNEQTQLVKQGSDEMLGGSREVILESENLEKVTVEISDSMNEMANGANEINTAIDHINGLSKQTKEYIGSLFDEVSKFKVE